jgi:hypothetical protein
MEMSCNKNCDKNNVFFFARLKFDIIMLLYMCTNKWTLCFSPKLKQMGSQAKHHYIAFERCRNLRTAFITKLKIKHK